MNKVLKGSNYQQFIHVIGLLIYNPAHSMFESDSPHESSNQRKHRRSDVPTEKPSREEHCIDLKIIIIIISLNEIE